MLIPCLDLCGAQVLTQLLHHAKDVFQLPMNSIFAWTDTTIILSWLTGNPRQFKTFVGSRVSFTVGQIPPDCWNHVDGTENPAIPQEACYVTDYIHGLWMTSLCVIAK